MAEKVQQEPTTTGAPASTDLESAMVDNYDEEKLRCKKRMRRLAYVAVFTVLLTAIVLSFSLTVMHIKNPKFRFRSIEINDFSLPNATSTTPLFGIRVAAELTVKNMNFGRFKYDESSISMSYGGINVGEAFLSSGEVKVRFAKVVKVTVDLSSDNILSMDVSNLAIDMKSGILTLTGDGRFEGKVHLMKVFEKEKSPQMNCAVKVDLEKKSDSRIGSAIIKL